MSGWFVSGIRDYTSLFCEPNTRSQLCNLASNNFCLLFLYRIHTGEFSKKNYFIENRTEQASIICKSDVNETFQFQISNFCKILRLQKQCSENVSNGYFLNTSTCCKIHSFKRIVQKDFNQGFFFKRFQRQRLYDGKYDK